MSIKSYRYLLYFLVLREESCIHQEQFNQIRTRELISSSLLYTAAQCSVPPGNEISSVTSSQNEIPVTGGSLSFQSVSPPTYLLYYYVTLQ